MPLHISIRREPVSFTVCRNKSLLKAITIENNELKITSDSAETEKIYERPRPLPAANTAGPLTVPYYLLILSCYMYMLEVDPDIVF